MDYFVKLATTLPAFLICLKSLTGVVNAGSYCYTGPSGSYKCENSYTYEDANIGQISAIIIGSLVALALVIVILLCAIAKCKKKKKQTRPRPNRNDIMTVTEVDNYGYMPAPPPYAPPAYESHRFSSNPLAEPPAPTVYMTPSRITSHQPPSRNIGHPVPRVTTMTHAVQETESPDPGHNMSPPY